jgi:hypothetical protein
MNWKNGSNTFPMGIDAEVAWCIEVHGLSKQTSTFFDPKRRNRFLQFKEPGPFTFT